MSIAPDTVQRLTGALSQLVRDGRHLGARAAASIYGDLPPFGWSLLVPLEREPDQRTGALAERAGIDISVASRQLAALERRGFVERRPDPRDGRAALFRLTPDGSAALAASRTLRAEWAETALADWSEDDARQLAELLDRLVVDIGRAAARRAHQRARAAVA